MKMNRWTAICVVLLMGVSSMVFYGSQDASAGASGAETGYKVFYKDSNIYMVGTTTSYAQTGKDVILLKYDSSGTLKWFTTWGYIAADGSNGDDVATSLFVTTTSIYVTGATTSNRVGLDRDVFILKYDTNGNPIANQNFPVIYNGPNNADDYANGITADDNYIYVGGFSTSPNGEDPDILILRYRTDGSKAQNGWVSKIYDGVTDMLKNNGRSSDVGNSIVAASDYLYIAGWTDAKHVNQGKIDLLIVKVKKADGSLVLDATWPIFWDGGMSFACANDMALNSVQNPTHLYLAGELKNLGGPGKAAFLKYQISDGSRTWVNGYGGPSLQSFTRGNSIASDNTNVYVVGTELDPVGRNNNDIFILKRSSDGVGGWTKTWSTSGNDLGWGIAVDSANPSNVYVVGGSDYPLGQNTMDIVLAKYGSDGACTYDLTFGESYTDEGNAVACDTDYVYVTGATNSYSDGKKGLKSHFDGNGQPDKNVFVLKYSKAGALQWYKTYDGGFDDCGYGIAVSGDNLYICGYTYTAADSDKTWQHFKQDILLLKMDKNTGRILKTKTWNGVLWGFSYDDCAYGIAVYDQAVYTTGYTYSVNGCGRALIILKYNLNLDQLNFDPWNPNPNQNPPLPYLEYGFSGACGRAIGVNSYVDENQITQIRVYVAGESAVQGFEYWQAIIESLKIDGTPDWGNCWNLRSNYYPNEGDNCFFGITFPEVIDPTAVYVTGTTYTNGLVRPLVVKYDPLCNPVTYSIANWDNDNIRSYSIEYVFEVYSHWDPLPVFEYHEQIFIVGTQEGTTHNWNSRGFIAKYEFNTVAKTLSLVDHANWGATTDNAVAEGRALTADWNNEYPAGCKWDAGFNPGGSTDSTISKYHWDFPNNKFSLGWPNDANGKLWG